MGRRGETDRVAGPGCLGPCFQVGTRSRADDTEYHKGSLTSQQLKRRPGLTDLRRAARHDEELRKLIGTLGL